jgi:hypothetical protein
VIPRFADAQDPEPQHSSELNQLQELRQSSVEFHDYADRVIEMVRHGHKDRAINFVEKTFDPLINTPLVPRQNLIRAENGVIPRCDV